MTNKSDEKECGCPKCREARGETFNGVTREERARITHEEFLPILAKHGEITAQMLDVLAKMNGHKTRDMGNDFALAILSALMSFIDTVSKPGTPQSAKYELFDMFVKHGRGQLQFIDPDKVKVVSFEA